MKNIPRPLASLLVVLGLSFSTVAPAKAGGKPHRDPPKIAYMAILSVDTAAKTITIGPKNSNATGTKTYKFTDQTTISANGHYGTAADLTPGQQIHIGTGMDETIAETLSVTAPPADPKGTKPK